MDTFVEYERREFQRGAPARRAVRYRPSAVAKLAPTARQAVVKAQKRRVASQVAEIPLDQIYELLEDASRPGPEHMEDFPIVDDEAVLLRRVPSGAGALQRENSMGKVVKKKKVAKPGQLKRKVGRMVSAIDKFFSS